MKDQAPFPKITEDGYEKEFNKLYEALLKEMNRHIIVKLSTILVRK